MGLAEIVARAGHLFALSIAPLAPSPEPLDPGGATGILLGVAAIVSPPLVALWVWHRNRSFEGKLAVWLSLLGACALLYAAGRQTEDPLLCSYFSAAPCVWVGLAAVNAALAGEFLGTRFRNKRMGAAIVTLALGIFLYKDAHAFVASPRAQWQEVLGRDPANDRALAALEPELSADPTRLDRALERCLDVSRSCRCLLLRAERRLALRRPADALSDLTAGPACTADDPRRRARARAVALAATGALDQAEALVTAELERAPNDPALTYALALTRDKQGRTAEALELAGRAAATGAGDDASLLHAALLIRTGNLSMARPILEALAKSLPADADVAYDLALIADREGRYNDAREAYLRALQLRPDFADARYNLALLTLRYGAADEARSHARRFRASWPKDPRGPELAALVQLSR